MEETQQKQQKPRIDPKKFSRGIKNLYKAWDDTNLDADAVFFLKGNEGENVIEGKVSIFHLWLLSYEFSDTIIVFTKQSIMFVTNKKKVKLIEDVKENINLENREIHVFRKQRKTTNKANFQELFKIIEKDSAKEKDFKYGTLTKEVHSGKFINEFEKYLGEKPAELVDISKVVQEALCVKSDEEIDWIKNAAKVTTYFASQLIEETEGVIDEEIQIQHSKLSKKIEDMLEKDAFLMRFENKHKMNTEFIDLCYTPIVQSGGKYDLRPQAESTDENLSYDTIICSVGGEFRQYKTNIVRTLLINPTEDQKQNYILLRKLQLLVIKSLKDGAKLNEVYAKGFELIKKEKPELIKNLTSYFGFGIGLEFKESNLTIKKKNSHPVSNGMVFNVAVSFKKLINSKDVKYSMMISDTVLIQENNNLILTNENQQVASTFDDISYVLEDPEEEPEVKPNELNVNFESKRDKIKAAKRKAQEAMKASAGQIQDHQKQLRKKLLTSLEQRFKDEELILEVKQKKLKTLESFHAYPQNKKFPTNTPKLRIYIDFRNFAVLFPIQGEMIPFHIKMIKSVSKQDEGKRMSLRFNFSTVANQDKMIEYPGFRKEFIYIRELIFRSTDKNHFLNIFKDVKIIKKSYKQQELKKQEEIDMVDQESLKLLHGKRPSLDNIKVRPVLSGRKTLGVLEAHKNGFRYLSVKNEKIELLYNNVKHAFFQPVETEHIVLMHFHLKNPIVVGKKKAQDIQFFIEAGAQVEEIDQRYGRRRSYMNEYEEENRLKQMRKKLNAEFKGFIDLSQRLFKDKMPFEFDIPYRELGFYGSPFKSAVKLYPTVDCLIGLSEMPFFVINLADIEIANFERMSFSLRNFDLTFVFKDFTRPPMRINCIPSKYSNSLRTWLDQMDIVFSESNMNFNWGNILKNVCGDIEAFIEDGGWDFLFDDAQANEGEEGSDVEESGSCVEFGEEELNEAESEEEFTAYDDSSGFEPEELSDEGIPLDELGEQELSEEDSLRNNRKRKRRR